MSQASSARRTVAFAIIVCLLSVAAPAFSQTAVQHHSKQRKETVRDLRRERSHHRRSVRELRQAIRHANSLLALSDRVDPARRRSIRRWAISELKRSHWRFRGENRTWRRRIRKLRNRIAAHASWLSTNALFEVCPVPGYSFIHDDFGEIVRVNGVKPHVHMGSDVSAPYGARIVAPFDGLAQTSWSELGGYEVRVYGARGYVYNAHLAGYGRTGYVRTGDTIGYVGSTGLSTAPHDHIEWHPAGGGAVDPYRYLALSCIG